MHNPCPKSNALDPCRCGTSGCGAGRLQEGIPACGVPEGYAGVRGVDGPDSVTALSASGLPSVGGGGGGDAGPHPTSNQQEL